MTNSKIDFSQVIEKPEEMTLYSALVQKILDYLKNNGKSTFQQIVKYVEGSDRRTLRLLNQMVECEMIKFDHPYFLSIDSDVPVITVDSVRCDKCDSKMVAIDGKLKEILVTMEEIFAKKPKPTFVFDQRPVNAVTTVRRVGYAVLRGDLNDKNIVVIGDDDLTSIALALTGMPKKVTVFDIDKRLLDYISKVSAERNLNIEVVNQDLTKGVSDEFFGKFDVFTTDPTPSEKPFTVFTNIGIDLVKPNGVGYISINPSHSLKLIELQRVMTDMNLLITDSIPYFTQYDFIPHTYSDNDKVLLEKYASPESKISFYEYLIRTEKTELTKKVNVDFDLSEIIGKATKRVLDDPSKDPVLSGNEDDYEYVKSMADLLVKNIK
jgi:predicted methyltransferase